MRYFQLPYNAVQEANASVAGACGQIKMNREVVAVLLKIASALDLDTYSRKDAKHIVSVLFNQYLVENGTNMVDACSRVPYLCDALEFTVREIGLLSKLSVDDFEKFICNFRFKTTCEEGDENCNVDPMGPLLTMRQFCEETCKNKTFKEFHENYWNIAYQDRYDGFYNDLCTSCKSPKNLKPLGWGNTRILNNDGTTTTYTE